jgi:hypothetical protein
MITNMKYVPDIKHTLISLLLLANQGLCIEWEIKQVGMDLMHFNLLYIAKLRHRNVIVCITIADTMMCATHSVRRYGYECHMWPGSVARNCSCPGKDCTKIQGGLNYGLQNEMQLTLWIGEETDDEVNQCL